MLAQTFDGGSGQLVAVRRPQNGPQFATEREREREREGGGGERERGGGRERQREGERLID